jgi:2'-5' RNA ligase
MELPPEVRQALARLQTEMKRRPSLACLRWVRPEGIHLTLKFLGESTASVLPSIERAIESAATGMEPVNLRLGKPGTFGGRTAPRVLWTGVEGDISQVSVLQQRLERSLETAGFPRETRPFSPHLTLARVPPERAREVAADLTRTLEEVAASEVAFVAKELAVMRSELRPGGAVYTQLFAARLSGGTVDQPA